MASTELILVKKPRLKNNINNISKKKKKSSKFKKIWLILANLFSSPITLLTGVAALLVSIALNGKTWNFLGVDPVQFISLFMVCVYLDKKTHRLPNIATVAIGIFTAFFIIFEIIICSFALYNNSKNKFDYTISLAVLFVMLHIFSYVALLRLMPYVDSIISELSALRPAQKFSVSVKKIVKYTAELAPFLTVIASIASNVQKISEFFISIVNLLL